ncbi:transcriptional coactivator/pterin dehydratase [Xylogone sp. PMI_703]|nr:transcriptional coactivator/pterin dehydratase [Xylogone sp. PMI_703]
MQSTKFLAHRAVQHRLMLGIAPFFQQTPSRRLLPQTRSSSTGKCTSSSGTTMRGGAGGGRRHRPWKDPAISARTTQQSSCFCSSGLAKRTISTTTTGSPSERRSYSSSSSRHTTMTEPVFADASGVDVEVLKKELEGLLVGEGGGRWRLTQKGNGVERSFRFKGFKKAWEFMDTVAKECQVKKHHPEWSNVYNTTFIRWTTHSPPGLTEKDLIMARYCDEIAAKCGEVEVPPEEVGGVGKDLADQVADVAGDCCVPKKKA